MFPSLNLQGILGLAASGALAMLLGLQAIHLHHWKSADQKDHAELVQTKLAYGATTLNYREAAQRATQLDAQNRALVAAKNSAIGKEREAEYEARIANARAAAERLRQQSPGPAADPRGAARAPVPGVSTAPGRPVAAPAKAQLPRDDALTATEQAIQLDELIKWVYQVRDVDVNRGGK